MNRFGAVVVLSVVAAALAVRVVSEGALTAALPWLYVLPPLAFVLLGVRAGILLNAALLPVVAASVLLGHAGPIPFRALDVLPAYVLAAVLACINALRNHRRIRVLEEQSVTDALTGALNRRRLRELIELEIRRAQRHGVGPAVVICDIDHFKRINDSFGHRAGDEVLRHVVGVVRANVRQTDSLVRIGGDEFLVLAPETPAGAALWLAEKLRGALKQSRARNVPVTVCMGVAQWRRGEDAAALLVRADQALYRAKSAGRDRVACDPGESVARERRAVHPRRVVGVRA